jgi:hypothetical protein
MIWLCLIVIVFCLPNSLVKNASTHSFVVKSVPSDSAHIWMESAQLTASLRNQALSGLVPLRLGKFVDLVLVKGAKQHLIELFFVSLVRTNSSCSVVSFSAVAVLSGSPILVVDCLTCLQSIDINQLRHW